MTFEQRPVDGEGRSHTDIGGKIILGTGNGQCSGPEVEGCLELSGTARRHVAGAEARGDAGPPCRPRFCVNRGLRVSTRGSCIKNNGRFFIARGTFKTDRWPSMVRQTALCERHVHSVSHVTGGESGIGKRIKKALRKHRYTTEEDSSQRLTQARGPSHHYRY